MKFGLVSRIKNNKKEKIGKKFIYQWSSILPSTNKQRKTSGNHSIHSLETFPFQNRATPKRNRENKKLEDTRNFVEKREFT